MRYRSRYRSRRRPIVGRRRRRSYGRRTRVVIGYRM